MRWYFTDRLILDLEQVEYIIVYPSRPEGPYNKAEKAYLHIYLRSSGNVYVYDVDNFLQAFRTYKGLL